MTVVIILGVISGMALTRLGGSTISTAEGAGFSRRVALGLNMARRRAISSGNNAAVVLLRDGGAVTSATLVEVIGGSDVPIEDSVPVPNGLTVTTAADRWEFDYTGALVAPASGGLIQVEAPTWRWQITTQPLTGHVGLQKLSNP